MLPSIHFRLNTFILYPSHAKPYTKHTKYIMHCCRLLRHTSLFSGTVWFVRFRYTICVCIPSFHSHLVSIKWNFHSPRYFSSYVILYFILTVSSSKRYKKKKIIIKFQRNSLTHTHAFINCIILCSHRRTYTCASRKVATKGAEIDSL